MNIYNGEQIDLLTYHQEVAGILQQWKLDTITLEDCNMALLLICGRASQDIHSSMALYDMIKQEKKEEHITVKAIYESRGKIPAIKEYRHQQQVGLKEAKIAVEELADQHSWVEPERN